METLSTTGAGVPVYAYLNHHLHSFCICMYVKAGSLYEKEEDNGITHFFEHIVIRNINSIMNGELYSRLDRLGLTLNGTTYKEFVQFSISGAITHFREATDIFLRLLDPLVLSEKELNTERKRVIAEIRECSREKNINNKAEKVIWGDTSLCRDIAGKKKLLAKMDRKRMMHFREEFYSAGNVFFYLTGNVSDGDRTYFMDRLDDFRPGEKVLPRRNLAPLPEEFFHRKEKVIFTKGKTTEVCLAFDVDTTRYTDAQMDLFYNVLTLGDYCPIYQELSEKTGYIYSYHDQFERYRNIGNFRLTYEVEPEKLEKALARTVKIFNDMKKKSYSLDYVRAIFLDNADLGLDDVSDFNWDRAYENHILEQEYPDIAARKAAYAKVTEKDLENMACEIFLKRNMTVIIRGNKDKLKKNRIREIVSGIS